MIFTKPRFQYLYNISNRNLLVCDGVVVGVVCRFLTLSISVGIAGSPPWGVWAPDLAVGTWAWVQTRRIRRSPAARARARPGTIKRMMFRGCGFVICCNPKMSSSFYCWQENSNVHDIGGQRHISGCELCVWRATSCEWENERHVRRRAECE